LNLKALKLTAVVNAFSFFRIPLLAFITPVIEELSDTRAAAKVRLDLRTRNHLGVMYFGALAMGAELSIAARALVAIQESGKRLDFIFKDFNAEFRKRADGHVLFVCDEGEQIAALVRRAAESTERVEQTFSGRAYVPSKSTDSVMDYRLTLSIKQRSKSKSI
jgi:hypothetical protein